MVSFWWCVLSLRYSLNCCVGWCLRSISKKQERNCAGNNLNTVISITTFCCGKICTFVLPFSWFCFQDARQVKYYFFWIFRLCVFFDNRRNLSASLRHVWSVRDVFGVDWTIFFLIFRSSSFGQIAEGVFFITITNAMFTLVIIPIDEVEIVVRQIWLICIE